MNKEKLREEIKELMDRRFKREFITGVYAIAKPQPRNNAGEWCEGKYQELLSELESLLAKHAEERVREFAKYCKESTVGIVGKGAEVTIDPYLQGVYDFGYSIDIRLEKFLSQNSSEEDNEHQS